jgi:hypothetical protein
LRPNSPNQVLARLTETLFMLKAFKTFAGLGLFLSFLQTPLTTEAAAEEKCPPGSLWIEYYSETHKAQIGSCQKLVQGAFVKHGLEIVYDKDGSIREKSLYKEGKKEEEFLSSASSGTKTADKKSSPNRRVIEILKGILPFSTKSKNASSFDVSACGGNQAKWIGLFVFEKSFTESYAFKKGCDIKGSMSPKSEKPFEASFKLRNLGKFTHVKLTMVITLLKKALPEMIVEVKKGELFSPAGKLKFKADYAVVINPLKKDLIHENKGGSITILDDNNKPTGAAEKIFID